MDHSHWVHFSQRPHDPFPLTVVAAYCNICNPAISEMKKFRNLQVMKGAVVDTKPLDKFFRDVHRLNKRLQWAKNNVLFKQVHQKRVQNFTWSFRSKLENQMVQSQKKLCHEILSFQNPLTSLACCRPLYWASKHSINRRKVMWLSAHESLHCLQCYHSTFGIVFFSKQTEGLRHRLKPAAILLSKLTLWYPNMELETTMARKIIWTLNHQVQFPCK